MKQEDIQLLLKDLCGRLPYGVKCKSKCFNSDIIQSIIIDEENTLFNFSVNDSGFINQLYISEFKPYLFPLSNITQEQEKEYLETCNGYCEYYWTTDTFDWFNANRIDYRGLIDKGLAIDATGLNIY